MSSLSVGSGHTLETKVASVHMILIRPTLLDAVTVRITYVLVVLLPTSGEPRRTDKFLTSRTFIAWSQGVGQETGSFI